MPTISKKAFFTGPLLIIIAALLWGFDGVLRRALGGLDPLTIVFFEHVVGLAVLMPFAWSYFSTESLNRKEWSAVIFVSLLSGVLGTFLFTSALLQTMFISFSVVFLLQKLQPLFAIATARILLKEKVGRTYLPWALLALVAAYFVTFPNGSVNFATGPSTLHAGLLALGAAFAWGVSTTFSKIALTNKPPVYITALRFFWTIVFAFLAILIFGTTKTFVAPNYAQAFVILVIALSTGMVSLFIYYRGLKNTPVAISAILELFFPLVAVLIDMFVYHNKLALSQYLAGIVLIFAIYKVGTLTEAFKKQNAV